MDGGDLPSGVVLVTPGGFPAHRPPLHIVECPHFDPWGWTDVFIVTHTFRMPQAGFRMQDCAVQAELEGMELCDQESLRRSGQLGLQHRGLRSVSLGQECERGHRVLIPTKTMPGPGICWV